MQKKKVPRQERTASSTTMSPRLRESQGKTLSLLWKEEKQFNKHGFHEP